MSAGSLSRTLGPRRAGALLVGATLGASVFLHPDRTSGVLGPAVPLAYLFGLAAAVAVAAGYAVFSSSPLGAHPGGAYLHVSRTVGLRTAGALVVWLKLPAYLAFLALASLGVGDVLARLTAVSPRVGAVAVLTVVLAVHLVGTEAVGPLELGATALLLAVVVGISVALVGQVAPRNFRPLVPGSILRGNVTRQVARSTAIVLFSFAGFETLAQYAGETRRPRHHLPRAFLGGVVVVGAVYLLVAVVTLGSIPWNRFPFSDAPFVDAAAANLSVPAAAILVPGSLLGYLTTALAIFAVPSRLAYCLSRDGLLPPQLGRLHGRFGTPHVGLALTYVVVVGLLLTRTWQYVVYPALAGLFFAYAAHGLAVLALPHLRPALYDRCRLRLRPAALGVVGLVATLSTGALAVLALVREPWQTLPLTQFEPALAPYDDLLLVEVRSSVVLALLGWLVLGVATYLVARDYRRAAAIDRPPLAAVYETDEEGQS